MSLLSTVDNQIKDLYNAEYASGLYKTNDFTSIEEIQDWVDDIKQSYKTEKWSVFHSYGVKVYRSQKKCLSYSKWGSIFLTEKAYNKFIILHELAHSICFMDYSKDYTEYHGKLFCSILLELVLMFINFESYNNLKTFFIDYGIEFS